MNTYVHIALFVCAGGGVYTKAAVVGANLTGQNAYGLEEDDCRNPDWVYVYVHIALFSRVGGGIYTTTADVGANLTGQNDHGLEEDDYRNPDWVNVYG